MLLSQRFAPLTYWLTGVLLILFMAAPAPLFASGCDSGGSGGGGGSDGSALRGPSGRKGPAMEPTIGIEGVPVMDPERGWKSPWTDTSPQPVVNRELTTAEKAAVAIIDYTKNEAQSRFQDMIMGFIFASNPEIIAAIKTIEGIKKGVDLSVDVLRRLEKEKKAYEKSAMGMRNSRGVQTGHDGTADAPGDMSPDYSGFGFGMPGPQATQEDTQLW